MRWDGMGLMNVGNILPTTTFRFWVFGMSTVVGMIFRGTGYRYSYEYEYIQTDTLNSEFYSRLE